MDIGVRVIRMANFLPNSMAAVVIRKQIIRSATSVGANYRAACRAKSIADQINKLKIVEEEADETLYWLELICRLNLLPRTRLEDLIGEIDQILAMTVASIKTLKRRINSRTNRKS